MTEEETEKPLLGDCVDKAMRQIASGKEVDPKYLRKLLFGQMLDRAILAGKFARLEEFAEYIVEHECGAEKDNPSAWINEIVTMAKRVLDFPVEYEGKDYVMNMMETLE